MTNKKSITGWIKGLKQLDINPEKLSFKELAAFRDLDKYLNGPISGPLPGQYLMRCFRYLTAFALINIFQNKIEPLTRCWDDLNPTFISSGLFTDGIFVESWIFCDFPCLDRKKTILDIFEEFVNNSEASEYFQSFIDAMKNSRYGLYQESLSSKKVMKLTELISGNSVEVFRSIDEFEKGEIFLTRIVKLGEEGYCLGNPSCWPKEYKKQLEEMIQQKLHYFSGKSSSEKFEKFMKYSGPYWMSCVVPDETFPVFYPDYYLTFF